MRRKRPPSHKIFDASKLKIGIVVAEFNADVTSQLLKGALETLKKYRVHSKNIKVVRVPGAFEIPLACQKLARTKKFDALVALGCVIKGETDHNIYLSYAATDGIMEVVLDYNLPIGFGILTPNNLSQAKARSSDQNNKGQEAALAALQMAHL